MTLAEFMAVLRDALGRAHVPYMLTGSVASSIHGRPRTTQDVDIVIAPSPEQLNAMLHEFPEDRFYRSVPAARDALARHGQFNIIELASGWKVDFIIRKQRPFSIAEFERRRAADVGGLSMDIATPEDVMLAKLEWAQESQSSRQLEDAAGILKLCGPAMDLLYVEQWVGQLGVEPQWREAKHMAYGP